MTLIWCLSPLIGFFLTPIFGSLSDRCHSNLGRRRPFIILLSIGVVLGKKSKQTKKATCKVGFSILDIIANKSFVFDFL